MTANRAVVYGVYPDAEDDRRVYLLESTALDLRRLSHAMNAALTWADFWTLLPDDDREELKDSLESHDRELPNDDTPFKRSLLPGVDDGDYPTYAPAYGTGWMPRDIAEKYGVGVDSVVSGSWTEYPAQHDDAIVAELQRLGYVVYRDDDLISEACGF